MTRKRPASPVTTVIMWTIVGLCVSALGLYFTREINTQYAQWWDQVRRENIPRAPLHITDISWHREASSNPKSYWLATLADETGQTATQRSLGKSKTKFNVGDRFDAYRLSRGRYLIPFFDKAIPLWLQYIFVALTPLGFAMGCLAAAADRKKLMKVAIVPGT